MCFCLVINPSLAVLDNLKLGRCFWIIFTVIYGKCYFQKVLFVNLSQCVWIVWILTYVPSNVFLKEPSKWLVTLVPSFRIISPHLRHSVYVPLFQVSALVFPRNLLRTYLMILARCLCSLFFTFAMLMKFSLMIDCIHNIEFG